MNIDDRNRLRGHARLPLLDMTAEGLRLAFAKRDAEFENYFRENRSRSVRASMGRQ
jgi:hypothetical protein